MKYATTTPVGKPASERRMRPRQNNLVSPENLRRNDMLAAMTQAELLRLQSHLELMQMAAGDVLYRSDIPCGNVYFPTTSIVSLNYILEDGACAEIAMIGNEGMLGVPIFMGAGSSPSRAVVLRGGYAYRINARFLLNEFNHNGPFLHLLLRYTQALTAQIAQNAVCNRHHRLYQQLCRFLLLMLDRQESNQVILTQDMIGTILGFRREGVTEAAKKMQQDGLITYTRGHIVVIDRHRLEQNACECYQVVKREYQRVLTQAIAPQSASSKGQRQVLSTMM